MTTTIPKDVVQHRKLDFKPQENDQELINRAKKLINFRAGHKFITPEGKQFQATESGKFNIVVDTKTGRTFRLIGNQLVFKPGEDTKISQTLAQKLRASFGAKTEGNIFIDSPGSTSKSNGVILIRSRQSALKEECDNSLVVDSPHHWGREASNNQVFNSPHLKVRLSHYCKVSDSGGTAQKKAVVDNSDEVNLTGSKGAYVKSCDNFDAENSPSLRAVFCSSSSRVVNSAGANLNGANSSTIVNSPKLRSTGSTDINLTSCARSRIFHSNQVKASNSPDSEIVHSENVELTDSEKVRVVTSYLTEVIRSGQTSVDRSPKACAEDSLGTKFITSPGSSVTRSPNTIIDNSDNSVIVNSPRSSTRDASELEIHNSPGTTAIDSIGAKVYDSSNVRLESSPYSIVKEEKDQHIVNQHYYGTKQANPNDGKKGSRKLIALK